MRIFGRILAVLGILALIGLVTGAAYSAGLTASGVAVQPATYALGFGLFGFGLFHFLGFILFFFLLFGLLRLAFGGGRHGWGGPGHMSGWGRGWGYGPGHGPGHGPGPGSNPGPDSSGDPREAWIRGRLEDWHRTAHAANGSPAPATPPPAGPDANPPA